MKRPAIVFVCVILCVLTAAAVRGQVAVTPEVQPPPTSTGGEAIATLPPPPDATPSALGAEQIAALPILAAAIADIDLLATQAIGTAQRPVGWSSTADLNDPDLPIKVRLNLELLATLIGGDARPAGWFGVVGTVPIGIARDIRHDLELLADGVLGTSAIRPAGWQGDNPIYRCGRATQAILILLEAQNLTIPVDFTQPDYCARAEIDTAVYVERNVLQPLRAGAIQRAGVARTYTYTTTRPFGVVFFDRDARRRAGVLPVETGFEAIGRSTRGFSNMTLIEGDGFRLYVDYTTTPLTRAQFEALPDFTDLGLEIFCAAQWCD
jgi:hypothetical protein